MRRGDLRYGARVNRSAPSPPRARLAYRVGVVGHRPNRLPDGPGLDQVRARVSAVLEAVQTAVEEFAAIDELGPLYTADSPLLTAVTPLAEGGDRLFAEEALRLGYRLCCPMPFPREVFETDFAPPVALELDSVMRFNEILDRAQQGAGLAVFELDGGRADASSRANAYAAAARVVLNQSDLLVAIWDGGDSAGRGGTAETLRQAIGFHIPVIWIQAVEPYGWMLLTANSDLASITAAAPGAPSAPGGPGADHVRQAILDCVRRIVGQELALPPASDEEAAAQISLHGGERASARRAREYFNERRPRLNFFFAWKLFRNLVGDLRLDAPQIFTRDYVQCIAPAWPIAPAEDSASTPRAEVYWINRQIRDHFAWSDGLADRYADAYRSSVVLTYLLAAFAVLVALAPRVLGWTVAPDRRGAAVAAGMTVSNVIELVDLFLILTLFLAGRARRWHDRWMEYRLLAELIRELKFLAPLGGGRPLPRVPTHLGAYGDPTRSWMYWHVRALARAAGLPNARESPATLRAHLETLAAVADDPRDGQRAFHETNFRRYENVYERLRAASELLFGLTFAAIVIRLATRRLWSDADLDVWLLFSAFLPALAAGLTGINYHGEFLRIAKRSRSLADGFARFGAAAHALRDRLDAGQPVALAEVTQLAGLISQTMSDEVVDWRVVVVDRPQTAG